MAVTRGSEGRAPAARYSDFIGLLIPLGVVALTRMRSAWVSGAWVTAVLSGGIVLARFDFESDIHYWKLIQIVWSDNTRKVLAMPVIEGMKTCPPATLQHQVIPWVYNPDDFWRLLHRPETTNIVRIR